MQDKLLSAFEATAYDFNTTHMVRLTFYHAIHFHYL
jgi:hypothetical protein